MAFIINALNNIKFFMNHLCRGVIRNILAIWKQRVLVGINLQIKINFLRTWNSFIWLINVQEIQLAGWVHLLVGVLSKCWREVFLECQGCNLWICHTHLSEVAHINGLHLFQSQVWVDFNVAISLTRRWNSRIHGFSISQCRLSTVCYFSFVLPLQIPFVLLFLHLFFIVHHFLLELLLVISLFVIRCLFIEKLFVNINLIC